MNTDTAIERRIVVCAVWMALGPLGFCLVLLGTQLDNLFVGLAGALAIALGFVGHLIANVWFVQSFTRGEVAFGTAMLTFWVIVFLIGWVSFDFSLIDMYIALALAVTVAVCVLGHLLVRQGARGAFSRFHGHVPD